MRVVIIFVILFFFCYTKKVKKSIGNIDYYINNDKILIEKSFNKWIINKKYPGNDFVIKNIISFYDSLGYWRNFRSKERKEYLGDRQIKIIVNFIDTLIIGRRHPIKNIYYVIHRNRIYLVPFKYIVRLPISFIDFIDKNQVVNKRNLDKIAVHINNNDFLFNKNKSGLWYFKHFRAERDLIEFLIKYFDNYCSDDTIVLESHFQDYVVFNKDTIFFNDTVFFNQYNKLNWRIVKDAPIFKEYFFNINKESNDIFAYNDSVLNSIKIKENSRFLEVKKDSSGDWLYNNRKIDVSKFLVYFYNSDFNIIDDNKTIDVVLSQHPEFLFIFMFNRKTEIISIYKFHEKFFIRNSLDKYLFAFPKSNIIFIEKFVSSLK